MGILGEAILVLAGVIVSVTNTVAAMFGELGAAIIGDGTCIPVEIVSRFSSESLDL